MQTGGGYPFRKKAIIKNSLGGVRDIIMALDKLSFKIIDGEISVGELPVYEGVVGIFINDREILDIVADLENKNLKEGYLEYIHQKAYQLYDRLVPDVLEKEWQKEHGTEILSCICGEIACSSPTVFI